jgi:Tfp pilus assembly protein PilV
MSASGRRTPRQGFTFMEVICILLVMTFGLLGVVGLVSYGMSIASRSQGVTSGMATALSVAIDPRPLLDQRTASSWEYTPYDMDAAGDASSIARGHINGFYVERTETAKAADIIARDGGTVYTRAATVTVEVYEGFRGETVASYTTHIVRQRGRQ